MINIIFYSFFIPIFPTLTQIKKFSLKLMCISGFVLLFSPGLISQPVSFNVHQLKITASDAQPFDYFGSSVAYSGNTVMVGAIGRDNYRGAVYVFEFDGVNWIEKQILTDPNATPGEFFGNSIDIDNNTAAIAGMSRGVVLIYKYVGGNWILNQTISMPTEYYYFGHSVDIKGDKLIIGCPADVWSPRGLAFIYTYNHNINIWQYLMQFSGNRVFGHSVAISSFDTYLIGDHFSPPGIASGVLTMASWFFGSWHITNLTPEDGTSGDNFTYCLSTSDNKIFIGAPGCNDLAPNGGAVYLIYNYGDTISNFQKIFPDSVLEPSLRFGTTISSGNKRLVVGGDVTNHGQPVYVFDSTASGFSFKYLVLPEFSSGNNRFGASVDVGPNDCFVVGASGENEQRGSVYLFTPNLLGSAFDLDLYAGIISPGIISVDTLSIVPIEDLPPGYTNIYSFSWIVNSDSGVIFDGGLVGNEISSLVLKESSKLCWLKRNNANSPWEYIGGQLDGNYLKSTIPFNSSCQLVVVDSTGATGTIDISFKPEEFILFQNYPNPFNPSTRIQYVVGNLSEGKASRQLVQLKVYDILGNEVATLVNEEKKPGKYEIEFNATQLSSGVYFYQLRAGSFVQTKKMILMR